MSNYQEQVISRQGEYIRKLEEEVRRLRSELNSGYKWTLPVVGMGYLWLPERTVTPDEWDRILRWLEIAREGLVEVAGGITSTCAPNNSC